MINAPDYRKATNAAYEVLTKYNGGYPHINIFAILFMFPKIKVHTYSELAFRLGVSIGELLSKYTESDLGFTVYDKIKGRWLIYYNNTKCETTIRSTLAHELGHIVLLHSEDNDTTNKEANCFARNILCPVPMRDELHLTTLDDYCSAFDISDRMAQVVIDRNSNDSYYITKENYDAVNDNAYCYFTGYTLAELYGYCEY